jgi:hypothetical protein
MIHRECEGRFIHELGVSRIKRYEIFPVQTKQEAVHEDSRSSVKVFPSSAIRVFDVLVTPRMGPAQANS